jgi:hypothetical protein
MTPDWTIPQDMCVRGFRDNRRLYYRILSAIGFCLIRQSSAGPIAIPRQTKIGSVNAHNSVHYFNRPVDRSVTNLAIQFRLGILPKRRSRPGSRDIVDFCADGTCLSRMFKEIESERHLTVLAGGRIFEVASSLVVSFGDSCLRRHIWDWHRAALQDSPWLEISCLCPNAAT